MVSHMFFVMFQGDIKQTQLSHEKKPALLSIESWLFKNGILISWFMKLSPYNWVVYYPLYMGVSKNKGTPKWMVKLMEHPNKIHDLGGFTPLFLG